jgi:hypothetical protein
MKQVHVVVSTEVREFVDRSSSAQCFRCGESSVSQDALAKLYSWESGMITLTGGALCSSCSDSFYRWTKRTT